MAPATPGCFNEKSTGCVRHDAKIRQFSRFFTPLTLNTTLFLATPHHKVNKYLHSLGANVIRYMPPSFAVGSESADGMPKIEANASETVDLCS